MMSDSVSVDLGWSIALFSNHQIKSSTNGVILSPKDFGLTQYVI